MRAVTNRTTMLSPPPSTPRLRLRPASPSRTPLDGAWWPRSYNPAAELAGLILALDELHGPITHLLQGSAGWDSHPRRLRIDEPRTPRPGPGRRVRLGWFDTMPAGLLTALCADGQRVDLLTVPPDTTARSAQAAMDVAADPANLIQAPDALAAIPANPSVPADQPQRATQLVADTRPEGIWESEGGRVIDPPDRMRPAAQAGRERSHT
jgi:hypothetical protein